MVRASLAEPWRFAASRRGTPCSTSTATGDHDDLNEVARRAGFVTRGQDDMTVLETTMPVDEASLRARVRHDAILGRGLPAGL